jgi:ketosteroid isomerase-like protein
MRVILAFVACLVASAAVPAQSTSRASSSTTRALLALEDGWARALVKRDTATFRRLLAPRFVYTENAEVMNKDDVIRGVTGPDTVTWAGNEGMKVHEFGRTAVVTGILAMRGRGKSGPFDRRYRFTDTWMRDGDAWRIVAAQDYLLP